VTRPLAGLHVVELANEISGPYATKLFVDLGAEVTKIEPPAGDPLRQWGPFPGGVPDPDHSGLFEYLNAGKRGATLDPARPDDRAAASELIARADLLVEDFAPGTLEGWGLGIGTRGLGNRGPVGAAARRIGPVPAAGDAAGAVSATGHPAAAGHRSGAVDRGLRVTC
jgi:CoA-transferase family III